MSEVQNATPSMETIEPTRQAAPVQPVGISRQPLRGGPQHVSTVLPARAPKPQVLRSSTMSAHTEPGQLSFEFSRM